MQSVKMFTKDPCPYCKNAKQLLTNLGVPFEEIDLTGDPQKLEALKKETGWKTVPMIFIGDKLVGGYMDLKALNESGQLEEILKR